MSFFSVGGNAGFALGPALTTPLVLAFGLPGHAVPRARRGDGAVLFLEIPRMMGFKPEAVESEGTQPAAAPEHWGPFVRMVMIVTVRPSTSASSPSWPLLRARARDVDAFGNAALTVMLAAGAVGTLLMGPLADRFGRRAVVGASMLLLPPLIYGFTLSGRSWGWPCSRWSAR